MSRTALPRIALLLTLALAGCATPMAQTGGLGDLARVGTVDERFLSYNVEMVEVTGGRFWRPYASAGTDRFEYRAPLDLSDPKLRRLASGLAPAFVRISGSWANAFYFAESDAAPAKPPEGFDTVLTHAQWRGVIDFAKAADAGIVTSFAVSTGTRDAAGVWQTDQASRWLDFTRRNGGHIAATEFSNEPNAMFMLKAPKDYGGAEYRRDYAGFASWLRKISPDTLLLAPGVVDVGVMTAAPGVPFSETTMVPVDQLIGPDVPRPDVFSFHYYTSVSERCGGKALGQSIDKALSTQWLGAVDGVLAKVAATRDKLAPGAPIWDTETGETACGGNPWAKQYADSFRFVDTLGRMAQQGVQVFMHNTLSASDYALLDEHTYDPRPNYWAALLWKRTMGTTVLAAPKSPSPDMHIYAHCLKGGRGGVGLAVVNAGASAQTIPVPTGRLWLLEAPALDSKALTVNGQRPALAASSGFTGLDAVAISGSVTLPARTIAFVAADRAANPACR